jgi:hypothetical protein
MFVWTKTERAAAGRTQKTGGGIQNAAGWKGRGGTAGKQRFRTGVSQRLAMHGRSLLLREVGEEGVEASQAEHQAAGRTC